MRKWLAANFKNYSTKLSLKKTPLYNFLKLHNAKFIKFDQWEMPLQVQDKFTNVKEEQAQCRTNLSIFDVSHMLQTKIFGQDRYKFLEHLVVSDIAEIPLNKGILTLITNENGGIEEDLIVTNSGDDKSLSLVSNAANAGKVKNLLLAAQRSKLHDHFDVKIEHLQRALIAVQGPMTQKLLESLPSVNNHPDYAKFYFMHTLKVQELFGLPGDFTLTRCGYTGEDGIEISSPPEKAQALAQELLSNQVAPCSLAGFAARDLLRLEAGLCLCGQDIDESVTPVEANLTWTIGPRRMRNLDFPGAKIIAKQIADLKDPTLFSGHFLKRVGLLMHAKGPLPRTGHKLYSSVTLESCIGRVTSGNFSHSLNCSIAMGYVMKDYVKIGTKIFIAPGSKGRGEPLEISVTKMPFVPTKYRVEPKTKTLA